MLVVFEVKFPCNAISLKKKKVSSCSFNFREQKTYAAEAVKGELRNAKYGRGCDT